MNNCSLTGVNSSIDKLKKLVGVLGCSLESWPLKYLGLPLWGDPKSDSF